MVYLISGLTMILKGNLHEKMVSVTKQLGFPAVILPMQEILRATGNFGIFFWWWVHMQTIADPCHSFMTTVATSDARWRLWPSICRFSFPVEGVLYILCWLMWESWNGMLCWGIPRWSATDPTWIGSKKGRDGSEFAFGESFQMWKMCMELYLPQAAVLFSDLKLGNLLVTGWGPSPK